MPHLDPERLVLIALGEQDPDASETGHLRTCDICDADLAATRATVTIGRQSQHVRDLPAPSEDLWTRIAAAAFETPETQVAPNDAAPRDDAAGLRSFTSAATGRSRARARRPRWRLPVAVGAAVVLAAVAAAAVTWSRRPAAERIVAEADLVAQPAAPAAAKGRATIVDTGHGLEMRVAMSGMPTTGGYYSVWLYDGRSVMVPIGSPGSAALNVPAAASDLTRFSIVDVSTQQLGQQQHGTSMLQGRLRQ
ncbi:anti-sigma-K factor RskA [Actinoplanes tereljensis]|uniref:Anti-sigma K factor RskA C-terminal domain-containing protein n=1 Tax=Paractinoplanes tereljensis TaxID=571912 RepID=A0A919TUW6_9ACTN|nr:anti-sigma factor [Actinoplanes tereljensis]GIF23271.1 hypothetical protein Ate02nite_60010 [Actinoplanes tereljensis]